MTLRDIGMDEIAGVVIEGVVPTRAGHVTGRAADCLLRPEFRRIPACTEPLVARGETPRPKRPKVAP